MHDGKCRCGHHFFAKFVGFLGFLAALGFLYTAWWDTTLWMHEMDFFFMHVVVFSLMAWGTKFCGCCLTGQGGWKSGMMKSGAGECKDGSCEMKHIEGHQH